MKKVILCFAHKDAYLLNTQIQQFLCENPNTDFYIHLDKKSESLKNEIVINEHIHFIKNNVSVKWGDDTMMKAVFASFKEIANNGKVYDWFIITTGQDLLVKKGLDHFLADNQGKIFLDAVNDSKKFAITLTHKVPHYLCDDSYSLPFYHPKRLLMSLYFRLMKYNIVPHKKLNFDWRKLRFYYSFNWSVMPYKVFRFCVEHMENNPDFINLYTNTLLPEDGFLATLIMNSKYAKDVVWKNDKETLTMTFHSSFRIHPKVLCVSDISDIDSSYCYFARKFDSNVDKQIIDYYKQKLITK